MEPHFSQRRCQCARSYLPRSTALFFLALFLPSTSSAQFTTSLSQTARSPTTFSTSTIPSSTTISTPTTTQSSPPSAASSSQPSSSPTEASHAFNYYFLIIAGVVIIISFCILYVGRQKKRKAALIHNRGQRALARDVEGWRSRFGMGRGGLYSTNLHDTGPEEGLNERGEAPPPYVPGSKPPSIRSEELRRPSTAASSHMHAETVELSNMGLNSSPPVYNEHLNRASENRSTDIIRPEAALTASERHTSLRRSASTVSSP